MRKDISGPAHLPQSTPYIHNDQDDQREKRNISRESNPFGNRQVTVAVLAADIAKGLEVLRLFHDLAACRTGSEPAARPRVLLDGGNGFIPNGPARRKNPVLAMPFIQERGCERVR